MRVHLIIGRNFDLSEGFYTVSDGWDEYCIDGNREGFNDTMDSAVADFGWPNVREVTFEVDDVAISALFDAESASTDTAELRLVWRIEDGELELVDAWDEATIEENPDGFAKVVRDGYRVTMHTIDWDDVARAFEPVAVNAA